MRDFLSGGVFVASLMVGIFFLRFWQDTRDRFFLYFSIAFFLLAIERIPLTVTHSLGEAMWSVYLIRLSAFGIITWAIVERNRMTRSS